MPVSRDADPQALVPAAALELAKLKELSPPQWSRYVKTGVGRQRPPQQDNWWHLRAASILRRLSEQPSGVSRLRNAYSNRKNRGHKPEHRRPASGAVIREILQQLEAAGLVKQEKGKGRSATPKGIKLLNAAAKTAS